MSSKKRLLSFPVLLVLRGTNILLSLVFIILIAKTFGASAQADLFFIAQIIPVIGGYQIKDAINLSLISCYSQVKTRSGHEQADQLASLCFLSVLVTVVFLVLIYNIAVPELLYRYSTLSSVPRIMYFKLIVFLSPALILLSLVGVLEGILYSYGRYKVAALANLCFYGCGIGSVLLFSEKFHIMAPAAGLTVGCFLQFLIVLLALSKKFRLNKFLTPWRSFCALEDFKLLLGRLMPLLYVTSVLQIVVIVQRCLAFSLGDGNVSLITYATRITFFFPFLMYSALIVPGLSSLSVHIAHEDRESFQNQFKEMLRIIIFFGFPVLIWLLVFRETLVRLLLQRGIFSSTDTYNLAVLLLFSLPTILPVMYIHISRQSLLAMNKMKQISITSSASVLVGVLLSFLLMFPLQLKGIVLGSVLGIFLQFLLFDRLLSKYSGRIWVRKQWLFCAKILFFSCIALFLSYAFGSLVPVFSASSQGLSVILNFLIYLLLYVGIAVKTNSIGLMPILNILDRRSKNIAK